MIKLVNLTNSDILHLKEYTQVISPQATALDMLQGEYQAYLGYLLPTLAVTIMKLENIFQARFPSLSASRW